jgi:hypothetical protein
MPSRHVLVLAAIMLLGCNNTRPPERPAKVPPSAVWAGGADGGSWIDCAPIPTGSPDVYSCTVYLDPTGDAEVWGTFRLHGRASPPLHFSGFDGDTIYLADGAKLEPLEVQERQPSPPTSPSAPADH